MVAPPFCLEKFPGRGQVERQWFLLDFLNGGNRAESPGRPRQMGSTAQSAREESAARRESPEAAESHLQVFSRGFTSTNMWGEGTRGGKESYLNGRESRAWCLHSSKNSVCSPSQTRRPRFTGRACRRVWLQL